MSPDDVFAAQFWPWPDPAIKRDMEGRILFVNAAFLALYGGRVEDWRGNAIGGWPAPQPPVQGYVTPYRFETRLPDEMGGEQIYDWIEQPLADGNAFALARNVTIFNEMPDPDPVAEQPVAPEQAFEAAPPPVQEAPQASAEAVLEPAMENFVEAPLAEAPLAQADYAQELAAPAEAAYAEPSYAEPAYQEPVQAEPALAAPEIPIPNIEIPTDENYALTQPVQTPAYEPATQEPREYERRALPIEPESAVLGNNWRDAVIAKAVGVEENLSEPAPQEVQPAEEPKSSAAGSVRILLAEDNAINALLTRTLLEAEGHSVETVEDGALAVEAMKKEQYDLIFMDMRMPNMDGLEATRKIRTLPNVSKHLPIIALTANAFDDDRNACFDSGMNDFMTKPVSAEELSEMVAEWTGDKAQQRLAS